MAANLDSPGSPPPALLPWCRDLAEWPQSWMGDERDLVPGQKIVAYFTPFLLHLAGSGLAKKTIQKHVDNLWVLGGEIIRDLQETPKLRKKPVNELIDTLLENDGPLIYHCDSQAGCPRGGTNGKGTWLEPADGWTLERLRQRK